MVRFPIDFLKSLWLDLFLSLSPGHLRGLLINTCLFFHLTQHHPSNLYVHVTLLRLGESGDASRRAETHSKSSTRDAFLSLHKLNNYFALRSGHVNVVNCLKSGYARVMLFWRFRSGLLLCSEG